MLLTGLLALAATTGCAKNEPTRPSTTTITAAAVVPYETAIHAVTNERCTREIACLNIGPGKRYDTFEICLRELEKSTRAGLHAKDCANGVSDPDLTSCLAEIRGERCADVTNAIEHLASCKKTKLCQ
jgi:hypothetical protein